MKVHNLTNTGENTCNCGSWILHWERFSGRPRPQQCVVLGCTQPPQVGGHVQRRTGSASWYIIPICRSCNGHSGDLDVRETVELVSANVSDTCGK